MLHIRSRRRIPAAPALFLALGAVLLCSAPAPAADQTNPKGTTITANPGMKATADGDHLTNNGIINVTGAKAQGMYGNFVTLTNNGTITATATDDDSHGMFGGNNSTLTNNGTITATATDDDSHGMFGGNNSTLTNNGAINATATATDKEAVGMFGSAYSRVINSGTISASATGTRGQTCGMSGGDYSTLANSGTITATGVSESTGMMGSHNSTLTNSGSITLRAIDDAAIGMSVLGEHATLANSGTITATGEEGAHGMYVQGDDARLTNSGTITATGGNIALGFYHQGQRAILTNSGTITATTTNDLGQTYGISAGNFATLANTGTITATVTGDDGTAYGMALRNGTAANTGLVRAVAANPANAWEVYGTGDDTTTVRITNWATDLRDFTTHRFFGSDGTKLDLDGSHLTLRPGTTARGFAWGREYAVSDLAGGLANGWGQGAVASVTQEVPWVRARLTGTDWRDQKLSLHPNFTAKTNLGQGVSRQGVALVAHQMFSLTDALGQFRNSSAPVAFSTASGPNSSQDENGWSGFLTPYFSYVDNSDLDYDAKIVGFMAGASRRFSNQFSAGVHLGFSHADVSADLADQDGDTLTGLLGLHAV